MEFRCTLFESVFLTLLSDVVSFKEAEQYFQHTGVNKNMIGIIYVVHHVIVMMCLNILIHASPMKMQTILILKTKKKK